MKSNSFAGTMMVLASILVLGSIYFEYQIGWIGEERSAEGNIDFMAENWKDLSPIWMLQALGYFFFMLAYISYFRLSKGGLKILWALLSVCGVLLVVSMIITQTSYGSALEIYDTQPAPFESVRRIVLPLYTIGKFGSTLFGLIYLVSSISGKGRVGRTAGLVMFTLVIAFILIGTYYEMDTRVIGVLWFILPLHYGLVSLGKKNG
jgi:hypothetical protein